MICYMCDVVSASPFVFGIYRLHCLAPKTTYAACHTCQKSTRMLLCLVRQLGSQNHTCSTLCLCGFCRNFESQRPSVAMAPCSHHTPCLTSFPSTPPTALSWRLGSPLLWAEMLSKQLMSVSSRPSSWKSSLASTRLWFRGMDGHSHGRQPRVQDSQGFKVLIEKRNEGRA